MGFPLDKKAISFDSAIPSERFSNSLIKSSFFVEESFLMFLPSKMRFSVGVIAVIFAVNLSGCASGPIMDSYHDIVRAFTPRADDLYDPAEEEDAGWIKKVGVEGRGGEYEVDTDPIRKYWLSPKAKSIERNMGIIGNE